MSLDNVDEQNIDTLDFIFIIDILKSVNIKQSFRYSLYHNRIRDSLYPPSIKVNSGNNSICYKWVISKDNLHNFRCNPMMNNMYFTSPNFCNNTWFIYAYPRYHEKYPKFNGMFL